MSQNEPMSVLLEALGESPKMRIIDFLLDNAIFDFTKKEIIEGSGLAKPTFYKYWDEVVKFGIVKVTRKVGKAKFYTLNGENEIVKKLLELEEYLIEQHIQAAEMQETPRPHKKPIPASRHADTTTLYGVMSGTKAV